MKILRIPLFIALLGAAGCAARSGDVIVDSGNVGVGLADGIHELQKGVAALSPDPIPAERAKMIQTALLGANKQLARLPDFLEAADAARRVGQVEGTKVEETIAIIASITDELNVVIQGLDVGEATSKLLKLAAETRITAANILTGLAKLHDQLEKK